MLVLGAMLAAASGLGYNATAAVQKHEAVRTQVPARRLLPALLRRRLWLLALLLDLTAWVVQAAALALAPIELVIPLMAVGTVLLVVLGVSWLGERFGGAELTAVALVVAGASLATAAAGGIAPARAPLSDGTQIWVAAAAGVAALLASRSRSGVALGTAAGCLYAATAIFTKEVGDRVMWLVQVGLRRANAASVTAAMTAVESIGPVLAGFLLYHERWPSDAGGWLLAAGIATATFGAAVLAARHERIPEAVG